MCAVEIGFHIDYYIKLWLAHLTKINVVLVQPIFADFKPFCSTFFSIILIFWRYDAHVSYMHTDLGNKKSYKY